jgi:hypothetical protein
MAALSEDVDFFIMNHHGLLVMKDELPKRKDIDLVILDEGSMFRNSRTKMYKALTGFLEPRHWLWILSGKPCPNGPEDAWALARLVAPDRVPKFFTRWQDETMRKVSLWKWVPREGSTKRMHEALQPAIRYKKEDCLDLPPITFSDRTTPLSETQQNYYNMMKSQLVVYAAQHQITAANAAILLGKLLQICAGASSRLRPRSLSSSRTPGRCGRSSSMSAKRTLRRWSTAAPAAASGRRSSSRFRITPRRT